MITVEKQVLYRAMCERCRALSPWCGSADEASTRLDGHRCEARRARRIQLHRTKGWRKPEGAIVIARPSRWGNPFTVASCIENGFAHTPEEARRVCVFAFRGWVNREGTWWIGPTADVALAALLNALPELTGHDLACWCPLDQPCHADVLLEMANEAAK